VELALLDSRTSSSRGDSEVSLGLMCACVCVWGGG
jgi:hypothetical protein